MDPPNISQIDITSAYLQHTASESPPSNEPSPSDTRLSLMGEGIKGFHVPNSCFSLPEAAWSPATILHHLACVPAKVDIDSLKQLLQRTKEYEAELSCISQSNYIHGIIARARTLRVLPRLVDEIHRRYAMLSAPSMQEATSSTSKTPLLPKRRSPSPPATKPEKHPASSVIEQAAREWTEDEVNYKLKKVSSLSHLEVQHLSNEVINQTVAIWLKQRRKIELFRKQQIRTCSLALLHMLKIAILDRLTELVAIKTLEESFETLSLSNDQESPPPVVFDYALTGLESASEQESCSSSSDALANFSLETSEPPPQTTPKSTASTHWNQSTLIKLAFAVPCEDNFEFLDKLLQTTAHYEQSLSQRIELVDLEMIGVQALKAKALGLLSEEICNRLYPPPPKLEGIEISPAGQPFAERYHNWVWWLPRLSFKAKPKNEQSAGIPFWSLSEMQKISKELPQADRTVLIQLSKTIQDYVNHIWPQQTTSIRQMEKEQYRIANLTLLCSLKFTIMEQMKKLVYLERMA